MSTVYTWTSRWSKSFHLVKDGDVDRNLLFEQFLRTVKKNGGVIAPKFLHFLNKDDEKEMDDEVPDCVVHSALEHGEMEDVEDSSYKNTYGKGPVESGVLLVKIKIGFLYYGDVSRGSGVVRYRWCGVVRFSVVWCGGAVVRGAICYLPSWWPLVQGGDGGDRIDWALISKGRISKRGARSVCGDDSPFRMCDWPHEWQRETGPFVDGLSSSSECGGASSLKGVEEGAAEFTFREQLGTEWSGCTSIEENAITELLDKDAENSFIAWRYAILLVHEYDRKKGGIRMELMWRGVREEVVASEEETGVDRARDKLCSGVLIYRRGEDGKWQFRRSTYRSPTVLCSPKVRFNRTVTLRLTAVCGYVPPPSSPYASSKTTLLWMDQIGVVEVSARDVARHEGRNNYTLGGDNTIYGTLALLDVTVEGAHSNDMSKPCGAPWHVRRVERIVEESATGMAIAEDTWPADTVRLDDVRVVGRRTLRELELRSASRPEWRISCAVSDALMENDEEGAEMTAVVVPSAQSATVWTALVAGPLDTLDAASEMRIFNYPRRPPPMSRRGRNRVIFVMKHTL